MGNVRVGGTKILRRRNTCECTSVGDEPNGSVTVPKPSMHERNAHRSVGVVGVGERVVGVIALW